MRIIDGVEMLEISANIMGKPSVINPTLLLDNETIILVDTGFQGQLSKIQEVVENIGISFNKINMVILTHHDIDHIGSLKNIKSQLSDNIKTLAHVEEIPYIQGDKCPIKLAKLEENLNLLSPEMKEIYETLKAAFQSCKIKIDKTLTDEQELPFCGGITVIHTPGHTIGHICLYLKKSKVLIAGDMLSIEDGALVLSPEHINYDNSMNMKSLEKLANLDIQSVICYNGGLYTNDVNKCIKELINK